MQKHSKITIYSDACNKVNGFKSMDEEFKRKLIINGKAKSTHENYLRQMAKLAVRYGCSPLQLEVDQMEEYKAVAIPIFLMNQANLLFAFFVVVFLKSSQTTACCRFKNTAASSLNKILSFATVLSYCNTLEAFCQIWGFNLVIGIT